MILGVDFDNTIVCYDGLFRKAALERRLVPESLPESKGAVRDHLRRTGREPSWTELQGHVYGPGMSAARPFPGFLEFLQRCARGGVPVYVISHRTRRPYLGPAHDLHAAALGWLEARGFLDPDRLGLPRGNVFLEETLERKLARIAEMACTHFIDDLPELLGDERFPPGVERVLFDPGRAASDTSGVWRADGWKAIEHRLFDEGPPR